MTEKGSEKKKLSAKKGATGRQKRTKPAGATRSTGNVASKGKGKGGHVKDERSIDKSPYYVLIIMVLLTIIVLIIGRLYNEDSKKSDSFQEKRDIGSIEKMKDEDFVPEAIEKIKDEDFVPETIEKKLQKGSKARDRKSKRKKISKTPWIGEGNIKIYLVYFNNRTHKRSLTPVNRQIKLDAPVRRALEELVKGPNSKEKGRGLLSAIPNNMGINEIKVKNKKAVLDFNQVIEENANGDILLSRIDQIVYTVTQFDFIDGVIIKINGKRRKFIGGEGLSISGPIYRRGK